MDALHAIKYFNQLVSATTFSLLPTQATSINSRARRNFWPGQRSSHLLDNRCNWGDRKSRETRMADQRPREVSGSGLAAVKDLAVVYSRRCRLLLKKTSIWGAPSASWNHLAGPNAVGQLDGFRLDDAYLGLDGNVSEVLRVAGVSNLYETETGIRAGLVQEEKRVKSIVEWYRMCHSMK